MIVKEKTEYFLRCGTREGCQFLPVLFNPILEPNAFFI